MVSFLALFPDAQTEKLQFEAATTQFCRGKSLLLIISYGLYGKIFVIF